MFKQILCPYCGNHKRSDVYSKFGYFIMCSNCHAITTIPQKEYSEAYKQWERHELQPIDDFLSKYSFERNGEQVVSTKSQECILIEDESEEEYYPVPNAKCSVCGQIFPSVSSYKYCPCCGTKVLAILPLHKGIYRPWELEQEE